jgi:hypothetical protein
VSRTSPPLSVRFVGPRVAVVLVVLIGVAGLRQLGVVDVFSGDTIDRERVEQTAQRALLSGGLGVADVTCPGGLEEAKGATIVCTYTDTVSMVAGVIADPEHPPPPATGRVEVRVSGFTTRGSGRRATSEPELSARVVEPAVRR